MDRDAFKGEGELGLQGGMTLICAYFVFVFVFCVGVLLKLLHGICAGVKISHTHDCSCGTLKFHESPEWHPNRIIIRLIPWDC